MRTKGDDGSRPARPSFLITIDTEGDNLRSKPAEVTTRNARFLPRFQRLCDRFGFKPTYLTNWEMANCPAFSEFAADVLARGAGEDGMHLHAWDSLPCMPLTGEDSGRRDLATSLSGSVGHRGSPPEGWQGQASSETQT